MRSNRYSSCPIQIKPTTPHTTTTFRHICITHHPQRRDPHPWPIGPLVLLHSGASPNCSTQPICQREQLGRSTCEPWSAKHCVCVCVPWKWERCKATEYYHVLCVCYVCLRLYDKPRPTLSPLLSITLFYQSLLVCLGVVCRTHRLLSLLVRCRYPRQQRINNSREEHKRGVTSK